MCGIFGFCGSARNSVALFQATLSSLRHRGPDAHGDWNSADGRIGLGHQRLAILDLSDAGAQPMRDSASGDVIVFNGEIYNHLDLRKELAALGLTFHGTSDTETVLRGFGVWGTELFPRLHGMFALALYQRATQSVVLARDRLGIKPLYLGRDGKGDLFFSSEVRALLPWTGREISLDGVAGYLQRGCCPHRQLLFKNIFEFPAGSWTRLQPGQTEFRPVVFWPENKEWSGPSVPGRETRQEPVAWKTRLLLEKAVASHLLSDVPVACFLSGGMDSSILAALAKRSESSKPLATFSVGFAEPGFDESAYAREVADFLKTDHRHIQIHEKEKPAMVAAAVQAMDLPTIDGINVFLVSRACAQAGFKVVLSGLGSDEIFGGYPIFRDFASIRLLASTPRWLQRATMTIPYGFQLFCDIPSEKTGQALAWWWRRVWSSKDLARVGLHTPEFQVELGPPLRDAMAEISWGETSHYLRDMLLRDADAMSMAHSLELRVPFLDSTLWEYVLGLPAEKKFDPRFPKSLLLQAARDLLPEQVWNRPKMGFSLPMKAWMTGSLRDYCRAGMEKAGDQLGLGRESSDKLWEFWREQKLSWPKAWAWVVLGHYLDPS